MRSLGRLLFILAMLGFVVVKSLEAEPEGAALREAVRSSAREDGVLAGLPRAAIARLEVEARERCARNPSDCLALLRTMSGNGLKRGDKPH